MIVRLLSIAEVADRLGVRVRTAYRILADNDVREVRGYDPEQIDAIQHTYRAGQGRRTDLAPPDEPTG